MIGGAFPKAAASALNKTAAQVKTQASRMIRERYNIKASDVNKTLTISRATQYRLQAALRSRGGRIPLIAFGARQVRQGTSVAVVRGQRKVVRHAFIATMRSGHRGVFMRKGKARLPIEEKKSLAVPQMLGTKAILQRIRDFYAMKLPEVFAHELEFFRKRAA